MTLKDCKKHVMFKLLFELSACSLPSHFSTCIRPPAKHLSVRSHQTITAFWISSSARTVTYPDLGNVANYKTLPKFRRSNLISAMLNDRVCLPCHIDNLCRFVTSNHSYLYEMCLQIKLTRSSLVRFKLTVKVGKAIFKLESFLSHSIC